MDEEAIEERAAILEYCAGMSRREAEKQARQCQTAEPAPLPQEEKQTPGYLAFRATWHSRRRKLSGGSDAE